MPVLIENTAGGDNAMARRFDALARLWDAVGEFDVGFCLDTCHAHAGGEELLDVVDRVKAITGRIDLVHLNDSRDAFGSGADRHANLERRARSTRTSLVAVCAAAGAPVLVETPAEGQARGHRVPARAARRDPVTGVAADATPDVDSDARASAAAGRRGRACCSR